MTLVELWRRDWKGGARRQGDHIGDGVVKGRKGFLSLGVVLFFIIF